MRGPLRSLTTRDHLLPGLAALLVALLFAITAGPLGAVLAIVITAVAARIGPVVGLLAVHLFAALTLADPPALVLIGLETACAPLLALPIAERASMRAAAAAWLAAIGLGGVVALASVSTPSLWLIAATLTITAATVLYAIHRVELVTLGLVDDTPTGDSV
ncbi:hypothetical protein [Halobaculum limi]|uniref:hypothetical protein n=1 Tax=Halobaculum limi TaxID=3031916 RepID=UPI0024058148|nr:hypothetical protein [Halobaculum sp. YSMS11]